MKLIDIKKNVEKDKSKENNWKGSQILSIQINKIDEKLFFAGTKCFNIMVLCLKTYKMLGIFISCCYLTKKMH